MRPRCGNVEIVRLKPLHAFGRVGADDVDGNEQVGLVGADFVTLCSSVIHVSERRVYRTLRPRARQDRPTRRRCPV